MALKKFICTCWVFKPVTLDAIYYWITIELLLNVQTLSEQNNAYYVLECSINGADFVPLSQLTALGNSGVVIVIPIIYWAKRFMVVL